MDTKQILKAARQQGWTVGTTNRGHIVFWTPDQDPDRDRPAVTSGGTPSDHRAVLNLAAQLRKAGLVLPHKGRSPKKGR